jgi:pectate lyase
MVKRLLFSLMVLLTSTQIWSQSVVINETTGWLESAYVKWAPVTGADNYNVYYSGMGITNQKIDNQLIRSYGTYFRADVLGLAAGTYTISVAPVISGVEATPTTTDNDRGYGHWRFAGAFAVVERQSECGSNTC